MKKIVFSSILLFGVVLFVPQSSFAQVVIRPQQYKTNKNIVVKKTNRHRGVTVKSSSTHHNPSRLVVVKPSRPKVIIKHPNLIRRNYIWIKGKWMH